MLRLSQPSGMVAEQGSLAECTGSQEVNLKICMKANR